MENDLNLRKKIWMSMTQQIAVIGAGVIGLTTGIRLLESGADVVIFARDISEKMASRAAPALWDPYKSGPEAAVLHWAKYSLGIFQGFNAAIGVQLIDLLELYHEDLGLPLWTKILTSYRELDAEEMPPFFVRGFTTQTYLIDTSIYVDYLKKRFEKLGGKIYQKEFSNLTAVDPQFDTIINCSGIGSFDLVPDKESFPIRGQYLLVEKVPELTKITLATIDNDNYILIVPRAHDCYIGGTTVEGDWNTAVDIALSEKLLTRAQKLEPLLNNKNILHKAVGLRPGRKTIRLEKEILPDQRTVIHNYGHGGSGFTVSWGCAEEVLRLLRANS
jgi:D-amino-acid oxidase